MDPLEFCLNCIDDEFRLRIMRIMRCLTMMMMMMMSLRIMRIMRCLITTTNVSSFSQANAHGSDSDLTAIASRKVFYGLIITANFGR